MASKKELEKTKELARLYYLNGDTQKLVAEKVGVIIEVLTSYNNWLAARTQIDKELTVDFLKMTNRYQDIFIAEQVSAENPGL